MQFVSLSQAISSSSGGSIDSPSATKLTAPRQSSPISAINP